eukprot:922352_1
MRHKKGLHKRHSEKIPRRHTPIRSRRASLRVPSATENVIEVTDTALEVESANWATESKNVEQWDPKRKEMRQHVLNCLKENHVAIDENDLMLSENKYFLECEEVLKKPPSIRTVGDLQRLFGWIRQSNIGFFLKFSDDALLKLCRIMLVTTCEEKEIVFLQGDHGDRFCVVLSGAVAIVLRPDLLFEGDMLGPAECLDVLRQGSGFGEIALIDKAGIRTSSVVSLCKTKLLVISKDHYTEFIRHIEEDSQQPVVEFLRSLSIFSSLSDPAIFELSLRSKKIENFRRKSVIACEQVPQSHVYFIKSGEIGIFGLHEVPKDILVPSSRKTILRRQSVPNASTAHAPLSRPKSQLRGLIPRFGRQTTVDTDDQPASGLAQSAPTDTEKLAVARAAECIQLPLGMRRHLKEVVRIGAGSVCGIFGLLSRQIQLTQTGQAADSVFLYEIAESSVEAFAISVPDLLKVIRGASRKSLVELLCTEYKFRRSRLERLFTLSRSPSGIRKRGKVERKSPTGSLHRSSSRHQFERARELAKIFKRSHETHPYKWPALRKSKQQKSHRLPSYQSHPSRRLTQKESDTSCTETGRRRSFAQPDLSLPSPERRNVSEYANRSDFTKYGATSEQHSSYAVPQTAPTGGIRTRDLSDKSLSPRSLRRRSSSRSSASRNSVRPLAMGRDNIRSVSRIGRQLQAIQPGGKGKIAAKGRSGRRSSVPDNSRNWDHYRHGIHEFLERCEGIRRRSSHTPDYPHAQMVTAQTRAFPRMGRRHHSEPAGSVPSGIEPAVNPVMLGELRRLSRKGSFSSSINKH